MVRFKLVPDTFRFGSKSSSSSSTPATHQITPFVDSDPDLTDLSPSDAFSRRDDTPITPTHDVGPAADDHALDHSVTGDLLDDAPTTPTPNDLPGPPLPTHPRDHAPTSHALPSHPAADPPASPTKPTIPKPTPPTSPTSPTSSSTDHDGSLGGRQNKRLGVLGNHSLPVVNLGIDPSTDSPPPLPSTSSTPAPSAEPSTSAPNSVYPSAEPSPSQSSDDLDFDFGQLNLSGEAEFPRGTNPIRTTAIGSTSTRDSVPGVQGNVEEDGGVRAPSNNNRGSIWDPNLGNSVSRVVGRASAGGSYEDLRRRASATSANSDGAPSGGRPNAGRRDSLQSGAGGDRSSLGSAEEDLALAAAMLQKRGSGSSGSNYESPQESRRESHGSVSQPAAVPRGPALPSNPAAGVATPRLSDGSRMVPNAYPSGASQGPNDDAMSIMSGGSQYQQGGPYAGYPGPGPGQSREEYEYAYYMQAQQAQAQAAAMHGHPGYAAQQAAWYGHPHPHQFPDQASAAAYYQQQAQAQAAYQAQAQAQAHAQAQAGMGGYSGGYYGHEYAGGVPGQYYAASAYGGYAPSAYGGGPSIPSSSSASVIGVSGGMANIPRRRGPGSISGEGEKPRERPPITKQSIDEYRNRIKNDQDPEAHFNFAKYLIEAAKKFGATATGEDATSRAVRKYRDTLLAESLKLIRRLATQGVGLGKPAFADAQFFLANCLGNGSLGLQPDHEKAYNLYVQASKQNHPQATYRTAVCNERGAGTRRDPNRAVLFYRKASALGDTPGMYKLGMILLNGGLGQPRNIKEAVIWLKRAAAQAEEENPHALFELGQLLEKPPREAPWVRVLITESRESDPALVEMAAFAAARDFYTSAGQFGHDRSQHRLGQLYEYGLLGCAIDPRRSIAWYTRAAEKGLDKAELSLSGWYLTGAEGVLRQNDNEAFLWARRAANKGFPEAELAVGVYYERGIGVDSDLEEAKRWFMRAAAQGNRKAMQRLTELRKQGAQAGRKPQARPTRQEAKEECTIM